MPINLLQENIHEDFLILSCFLFFFKSSIKSQDKVIYLGGGGEIKRKTLAINLHGEATSRSNTSNTNSMQICNQSGTSFSVETRERFFCVAIRKNWEFKLQHPENTYSSPSLQHPGQDVQQ